MNIGNALVYSLPRDLHLSSNQTNIALCVFFVSYVTFEIPANILMKRIGPRIFRKYIPNSCGFTRLTSRIVSSSMILFGLIVTMQGLVKSFEGLVTLRFLLGIAESGVFPGCKSFIPQINKLAKMMADDRRLLSSQYVVQTLRGAASLLLLLYGSKPCRGVRWPHCNWYWSLRWKTR